MLGDANTGVRYEALIRSRGRCGSCGCMEGFDQAVDPDGYSGRFEHYIDHDDHPDQPYQPDRLDDHRKIKACCRVIAPTPTRRL